MKRDAPRSAARWFSTLGLMTVLSCLIAFGASDAVARTSATQSSTQAQKLAKALKACKRLPRSKRAACVKRAKKKYAPHHHATTPTAPGTPPPTVPVTPTGPVAPAAPTLTAIEQLVCSFHCPLVNFAILERGVPRLGTGVSVQRGGDNVPSDTWIFPLLLSYDKTESRVRVGPPPTFVSETYTLTLHWREKTNAQIDASGALRIFVQAFTETCEPALAGCGVSSGGGA
jgi:hypothetical protein